jgi:phosphate transport system substrate-binding protein
VTPRPRPRPFLPPPAGQAFLPAPAWALALALALASTLTLVGSASAAESEAPFDLTGLPPYRAAESVHGVIRIHGTELTLNLIRLWERGFLKRQPVVRYGDYFVPTAFSGLCAGTADIGVMGHTAWRSDLKAFEGMFGYDPFEIMFATGGFNLRKGNTPGAIVFVNHANPLTGLTLRQLDGILGAERTGGWVGTTWHPEVARGPEGNLRTWGQLGLTGAWANQPIHIYGIDATLSNWSELIQRVVFHGGDKWNPAIRELVRGGVEIPADAQIVSAVAADPYAIGFNLMRIVERNPGVKALALATRDEGPFIAPTRESFYRRTYPLDNAVYLYLNRPPGHPLSPRLREFLTYVLSREGQADIAEDGMYLPLTPEAAAAELAKLK